jgi:hypothetical protein
MNVLLGRDFLERLKQAGALPPSARRVVIDASSEEVVHVYYECFGDPALLSIDAIESVKGCLAVHVADLSDP